MTAAHCIETEFIHMIGTRSYLVSVKDPYDASQFSVYVGAYDISFLNTGRQPPPQTIKMTVKKVIRVSMLKIKFLLSSFTKYIQYSIQITVLTTIKTTLPSII